MGERQVIPLEFGGGLDRATGVMVVQKTSFDDLRNVYLFSGKAELRKGLLETITFFASEEVLHVHPVRAFGIGAIFTYDPTTRKVWLYRSNGEGTTTTGRFEVWTIPVSAGYPRVSCDDTYGKLYIAHDEARFTNRQNTKVYDPATDTITDYKLDLYQTTGADVDKVAVKFRGVKRHLNYLCGWGWGTEKSYPASGYEADRPEILRISLPGEPDTMLALHYIIVGQRYEPINGCSTVNGNLVIRKDADSYRMVGESRANFGVQPIDELFGVVTQRLMVTVGDKNYFWSLSGPRVSGDGPSEDLALPINVPGGLPSTLASLASPAVEDGFAIYNPVQREVLFIFARAAYVLHLKDGTPRWSYRQYGVSIGGGGTLYSGVQVGDIAAPPPPSGGGPPVTPPVAAAAYPTLTATTSITQSDAVANWTNTGTVAGGTLAEVWLKEGSGAWVLFVNNVAVSGASGTATLLGLVAGTIYGLAVRFKLVGVYTSGYESSNPESWPAVSRGTFTTASASLAAPTWASNSTYLNSGVRHVYAIVNVISGNQTRFEISSDYGFTWSAWTVLAHGGNAQVGSDLAVAGNAYYVVRARHENTAGTPVSAWIEYNYGYLANY